MIQVHWYLLALRLARLRAKNASLLRARGVQQSFRHRKRLKHGHGLLIAQRTSTSLARGTVITSLEQTVRLLLGSLASIKGLTFTSPMVKRPEGSGRAFSS